MLIAKSVVIFLLAQILPAWAGVYSCGEEGMRTAKQLQAQAFLRSIADVKQLGTCSVEFSVCDETLPYERGSIVGDMLITDSRGSSFYVPFDFSEDETEKTKKLILNGSRMFHYKFIERIKDSQHGRTEAYRLEIVKTPDLNQLDYLEFGIYTSKLKEKYPRLPSKKSYWVNCEMSK